MLMYKTSSVEEKIQRKVSLWYLKNDRNVAYFFPVSSATIGAFEFGSNLLAWHKIAVAIPAALGLISPRSRRMRKQWKTVALSYSKVLLLTFNAKSLVIGNQTSCSSWWGHTVGVKNPNGLEWCERSHPKILTVLSKRYRYLVPLWMLLRCFRCLFLICRLQKRLSK